MSAATEVRERPILFSGEMVRAILDGRKTQTRRVCNPQPRSVGDHFSTRQHRALMVRDPRGDKWEPVSCPYGEPGDLLYVRERWAAHRAWDDSPPRDIEAPLGVYYRADDKGHGFPAHVGRWRPPIYMPKWAARLWLCVTDVRVERVQEIRCGAIRREGVDCPMHDSPGGFCTSECPDLRSAFRELWDSLNASRGYGWDENPWVWVVGFERTDR